MNPSGKKALVFGAIRAGRTDDQKQALVRRLGDALAAIADLPTDAVTVLTADVPASWTMEGGRLLPEPGAEDDWLAGTPG